MKRSLRLLLVIAPVLLLLVGVPAGVVLARRAPQELPTTLQPGVIATAIANGTPRPIFPPNGTTRPPPTPASRTGPQYGPPGPQLGPPLPVAQSRNGISGTVTRVGPDTLTVYTKGKKVAFVHLDTKTTIRLRGKNVKIGDIKRGDQVTILGRRDREGAFIATVIRVTRPDPPIPANGSPR